MYPYLEKKIVLVEGPRAFGIYDLNQGKFYRINKKAGLLLQNVRGTEHINSFSDEDQSFLEIASQKGLIKLQNNKNLQRQTQLDEVVRSNRPLRFAWIEITSKCNQKCLHCFLGGDLNTYQHQPKEKIFSHIATLVQSGVSQIVISGGEPTLHPDVEEILRYASQFPVNVTLLTNGASPKSISIAKVLSDLSISVKIPILGWRESHDIITALPGSFTKVIKTIHHYIREGVSIELGTTVNSLNMNDIHKIRKYANRVKIPLEVSPIFPVGSAADNSSLLLAHPQKLFTQICHEDKSFITNNLRPVPLPKRPIQPKQPTDYQSVDLCNYLTDRHECGQKIIAILSSGEVTSCLLLRERTFSMGNISEHSLSDLLTPGFHTRKDFDESMKLSNVVNCELCEARFACKAGGCLATSKALAGTIFAKNPLYENCYYIDETISNGETL
jgi:radical SAM protein with 4Fe4S-binding SPASM domain